jgi:phage baseplate assembly protein W
MEYLALPFILRDGVLERVSIHDSIAHSIGLILSTRVGQLDYAPDFGCAIWDKEFSDLYTINRGDIRGILRNSINKLEKRLNDVTVSFVNIIDGAGHTLGVKARITGKYKEGGKSREFQADYNLG